MYQKCTPTSKQTLRELAKKIRAHYDIKDICFPIYEILEKNYDDGTLIYEVVEELDSRLGNDEIAFYIPNQQKMLIKELIFFIKKSYLESWNAIVLTINKLNRIEKRIFLINRSE